MFDFEQSCQCGRLSLSVKGRYWSRKGWTMTSLYFGLNNFHWLSIAGLDSWQVQHLLNIDFFQYVVSSDIKVNIYTPNPIHWCPHRPSWNLWKRRCSGHQQFPFFWPSVQQTFGFQNQESLNNLAILISALFSKVRFPKGFYKLLNYLPYKN